MKADKTLHAGIKRWIVEVEMVFGYFAISTFLRDEAYRSISPEWLHNLVGRMVRGCGGELWSSSTGISMDVAIEAGEFLVNPASGEDHSDEIYFTILRAYDGRAFRLHSSMKVCPQSLVMTWARRAFF